ncbi:hypothetical protein Tco_0105363 [Tanacetum coccineum]
MGANGLKDNSVRALLLPRRRVQVMRQLLETWVKGADAQYKVLLPSMVLLPLKGLLKYKGLLTSKVRLNLMILLLFESTAHYAQSTARCESTAVMFEGTASFIREVSLYC